MEALVSSAPSFMPARGSGGYLGPNRERYAAWRLASTRMLEGDRDRDTVPSELEDVSLWRVTAAPGRAEQCGMMDTLDSDRDGVADRGWGMVVVAEAPALELHSQAPHPRFDPGTDREAASVSTKLSTRSLVVSGAHRQGARDANDARARPAPTPPTAPRRFGPGRGAAVGGPGRLLRHRGRGVGALAGRAISTQAQGAMAARQSGQHQGTTNSRTVSTMPMPHNNSGPPTTHG